MDVTPLSDPKPTPGRKSRRKMLGLALALTVGSLPAIGTMGQPRATLSTAEAAARRRRKPKRRQRRPKFKVVTRTFTNPEAITIPGAGASGPAARYPSTIRVDGLTGGRIEKVTVSMRLVYSKPDELDIMLVGPTNTGVILISDAGGTSPIANDVDLTFDQDAPGVLPDVLTSGAYQPSNYPAALDAFPAPAPAGVTGHSLTVFNGENPNGEWQLFIVDDDRAAGGGALFGWSITIRARVPVR